MGLEHWGKTGGEIMDARWSHERRFQRELQMFEKTTTHKQAPVLESSHIYLKIGMPRCLLQELKKETF